jgi:tRNA wybutosine-synthesizing protein 3
MKDFKYYKERALKEYKEARKFNLVDKEIIDLLELINSLDNYYTTSSCAGRVSIDLIKGEKKINHLWLFKTHSLFDFESFREVFRKIDEIKEKEFIKEAYLKFDNFIIHVGAKDLENAEKLLKIARDLGLKRSGIIQITPRVLLEIMGLDHLEFPIILNNKFLIDLNEKSLKELYELIIKKMEKNWERMLRFKEKVEKELSNTLF